MSEDTATQDWALLLAAFGFVQMTTPYHHRRKRAVFVMLPDKPVGLGWNNALRVEVYPYPHSEAASKLPRIKIFRGRRLLRSTTNHQKALRKISAVLEELENGQT